MITLLVSIVTLAANWFIYKKMGREGWEGIIPFYNNYVIFEVLYGNGWRFLTLLIPFYNIYVAIKFSIDLAKAFNKSSGFGWGLFLLSPVFLCILAFDSNIIYRDGSFANREADIFTKVGDAVSSNKVCQSCGKAFPASASYCPCCGAKYTPPAKKYCRNCGAALDAGDAFCKLCGAKYEEPVYKYCASCGARNTDGAAFCASCGAPLQ